MSDTLDNLLDLFSPDALGVQDDAALQAKLSRYVEDGLERVNAITPPLAEAKRKPAVIAWAKYRAYDAAWHVALSRPEDTELEGEGSVGMGDRKTILAALDKARAGAKAEFEDLTGEEIPEPQRARATITASTETVITW
jgi:hypothetical protein